MEVLSLPIDTISISGGTQSRVSLNEDTVAEYAEVIRQAGELPPVVVFNDGASDGLWLADGFHRYHAHRAAGAMEIACDVRVGTQRDAILHSVGANASHGLRRTNEDKRRAVLKLLNDPEWSQWSDSAIARACAVSDKTVGAHRAAYLRNFEDSVRAPNAVQTVRTVERNGKTFEQNTANIGKAKASDSPPVPVAPEACPAGHPSSDESDEPDLLSELEASDKECRRLQQLVADMSKEDLPGQVATWSLKFDQLSGRLAQVTSTGNEAAKQAKKYRELLANIRKALAVDSNSKILAALAALQAK